MARITELDTMENAQVNITTDLVHVVDVSSETSVDKKMTIENFHKTIPEASATARGVVSAGNQSFAGKKTFKGNVEIEGDLTIAGDVIQSGSGKTHNIPRMVNGKLGKDITAYYNDGTLWKRLNGTDGFALFDDIYVGDYFAMSRAITCPGSIEGTVGTEWVTIVGIDNLMYNGSGQTNWINYHHLTVMPGKGEEESPQHFGRQVMNDTDTAAGGYVSSKMNLSVIGPVTATGSTAAGATINQQLKAEFGIHLKTISELITTSIDATGINKFGNASGVSNNWAWNDVQAICPSEIEVYGSVQWSSSGFDSGSAGNQLPLFRFSRIAQNNRWQNYWLKDVASAFSFAISNSAGNSGSIGASTAYICVRPRFVLGA